MRSARWPASRQRLRRHAGIRGAEVSSCPPDFARSRINPQSGHRSIAIPTRRHGPGNEKQGAPILEIVVSVILRRERERLVPTCNHGSTPEQTSARILPLLRRRGSPESSRTRPFPHQVQKYVSKTILRNSGRRGPAARISSPTSFCNSSPAINSMSLLVFVPSSMTAGSVRICSKAMRK